jgi:uncharacterized RDD family membrane protein YckC
MLDNRHTLDIPEGAQLSLYCAGPCVRIVAFGFDMLIRVAFYFGLTTVLGLLSVQPAIMAGIMAITYFLLEWLYPMVFELLQDGMTPGKRYCGIKVVNEDGTPINFRNSLLRNLLRTVDFLPMFYMTGLVACVSSRSFQRLGDMAAGTLVVYRNALPGKVEIRQEGSLHPGFAPSVDEQRNLVSFAERCHKLSPQRAQELAGLLKDVLPPADDRVAAIRQIANGILGRK